MKKPLPILTLICLITISFYSCKKDGGSTTSTDSHVKLLTAGKWKLQKVEYEQSNGTWVPDPDSQYLDYYTIEFDTDNTYLAVQEGGQSGSGAWKFSSDYSQLAIITVTNGNSSTYTSGLTILNSTTLQLSPPDGYPTAYIGEHDTFTHP